MKKIINSFTVLLSIAIAAPLTLQAITAKHLPVYELPFYEEEYPYDITISINNTTNEPIFVLTRTLKEGTKNEIMIDPFSAESYTITIPEKDQISKIWVLLSFNQESVQQLAKKLNTARNVKYIGRSHKGSVGIVTVVRQKKPRPTLRGITINSMDLDEDGAWGI